MREQAEWTADFESHFGRTPARHGRIVGRLRIAGWVLMGGAVSAPIIEYFIANTGTPSPRGDDLTFAVVFGIATGGTFILGSMLLVGARILVGRRRRWQNEHGNGGLTLAEPERWWDLNVGPRQAAFSLRF